MLNKWHSQIKMFTNSISLHPIQVLLLSKEDYFLTDRGHMSASMLIQPVQQVQLLNRHADKLIQDVKDNVWRFFGTSVHIGLRDMLRMPVNEEHPVPICERPFQTKVMCGGQELVVTTQPDVLAPTVAKGVPYPLRFTHDEYTGWFYENCTLDTGYDLINYKVTSAYTMNNEDRLKDYAEQIENEVYVCEKNGIKIGRAYAFLFLRDWQGWKQEKSDWYPNCAFHALRLPIPGNDELFQKVEARIEQQFEAARLKDRELPDCTDSETWGGKRCDMYCDAAPVCIQNLGGEKVSGP